MSLFSQLPEDFVQYIWKTLNFDLRELRTTDGLELHIQRPGWLNRDQGPDFREARLQLAGLAWYGQVEIHLESDDWYRHGHHQDAQYDNTVLHVVLRSTGREIRRCDGTLIPSWS